MSNTGIHQRLPLPCLALGPTVLLFIVLWHWYNINIYFHLLSRATCHVKAMVMSILMEVHGQPRKRAQFSETCEVFGVNRSKNTEDRTHNCVGLNPAHCWLAVWLQAGSWTSLRLTSFPVKRDNNTTSCPGLVWGLRRECYCKVFMEYETFLFLSFWSPRAMKHAFLSWNGGLGRAKKWGRIMWELEECQWAITESELRITEHKKKKSDWDYVGKISKTC